MPEQNKTKNKPEAAPMPEEGYIDKHELARRVRRSVRTIEGWQWRKRVPFIKISNSVLYSWPEVQQCLMEQFGISGTPTTTPPPKEQP